MKEWNVYLDGGYIGTVHETNEELAICAALSKFDLDGTENVSVAVR